MKKVVFSLFLCAISTLAMAQLKGVEHVVLIGSDGFSAQMVREHAHMLPNINKLMKDGSWTLECRSVLPSSSAVNWASHLMGAGPELHGYTDWGSQKPDLPSRVLTENGTFPDIIWALRQKYPTDELGVVYSWEGIGYLFDTTAVSYNCFVPTDVEVSAKSVAYLKEKQPRFAFFYLSEPDHTGHTLGWQSEDYQKMCAKIDGHVGEIVAGVEAAGMKENTVIIFIADHGGINKGHGGKTMTEMQVPYVVTGPGVKQNYNFKESMMNFDDAATIAYILGAPQPQVWIGRPMTSIFETPEAQTVGRKFSIELEGNPTTGYQWQVASITSTNGTKLVNSTYVANAHPSGMVGVGGVNTFNFAAKRAGEVTVTMECKRAWEATAKETKTFSFIVE